MKSLKALFGLCVIVGGMYLAWMAFPPYFNNYQLSDSIDEISHFATYNRQTDEDIRANVLKEAHSLRINLQPEQVKIQRMQDEVVIWADYTVHIDLPYRPFDLDFHPASKNKSKLL